MDENTLWGEKELIKNAQSGSAEAFGSLVKLYQEKIIRYCSYVMADSESAKDVAQEVFIKAYINLNGYDSGRSFSSWIYRIAHNESINYLKKWRREVPDRFDDESENDTDEANIKSARLFEQLQAEMDVQKYMKMLPDQYREPLVLSYLEGYKYEEIVEILKIPIGTVSVRILRGKQILRKIINNQNGKQAK